jgi:hypothetical protein
MRGWGLLFGDVGQVVVDDILNDLGGVLKIHLLKNVSPVRVYR